MEGKEINEVFIPNIVLCSVANKINKFLQF